MQFNTAIASMTELLNHAYKYKEDNKPKNCKCSGVDLVFSNGTYWYCGNCKEIE